MTSPARVATVHAGGHEAHGLLEDHEPLTDATRADLFRRAGVADALDAGFIPIRSARHYNESLAARRKPRDRDRANAER